MGAPGFTAAMPSFMALTTSAYLSANTLDGVPTETVRQIWVNWP